MTKAEILERIDGDAKLQKDAIEAVNKLLKSVSMSDDTVALAAILHTICGCMCDTMNTLALILCEMLPEEAPEKDPEPKKSEHCEHCFNGRYPHCQCLTCARDHGHSDNELGCCMEHKKRCYAACPDYVKEEK